MADQNVDNKPLRIDIKKVIAQKNPKLSKRLPGFLIRYIEKIMHQEECNDILFRHHNCTGAEFSENAVKEWNLDLKVKHEDRIPKEGRFVFVANHPLGGIESLAFIYLVDKHFQNIKFPVNDLLCAMPMFKDIFLPINKHGALGRESARLIDEAFASDYQMMFYPAGLVSRKRKGKIRDLEWKKSFLAKSIKYKRDIIPVHINAKNTNFFYNLANIRKFFGIKANIEMFYLIDELFKQKNSLMTFTFGTPVTWQTFDKTKTNEEWAEYVKNLVYKMAED